MKPTITASAAAVLMLSACSTPRETMAFSPHMPMGITATKTHALVHPAFQHNPNARERAMTVATQMAAHDPQHQQPLQLDKIESATPKQSTDPTPFFVSMFQNLIQDKQSTLMAGAAMAMMVVMLASPMNADAAMSGGRMGGSFSSSRSTSISRPMSSPSSYRGSYGGGSSYRGSYGGGSSYYGGGYRSPTIIAPIITPGCSPIITPGIGYSPFYGGGGGVMAVSRGPSFFDLLLFGGFLFAVANILNKGGSNGISTPTFGASWGDNDAASVLGPGTSVVQLSVAIEVPNRDDSNSILSALNRLSRTSRTDSRVGIQSLTSQVALEILRRKSSIVSASSSYQHYRNNDKALRDYQSQSVKERSKFEQEQVSKFGGVDYSSKQRDATSRSGASDKATMAVITLLLAIDGDSTKIPKNLSSVTDVEEALRKIAADVKVGECLQNAEILWTPEDRSETLSLRDVVADYPELRTL